jgi:hypothetical protein
VNAIADAIARGEPAEWPAGTELEDAEQTVLRELGALQAIARFHEWLRTRMRSWPAIDDRGH